MRAPGARIGQPLQQLPRAALPEHDRGKRHAHLAEDLDRDEEAGEQEDDAKQLANEEGAGRAKPIQPARDRRDDPADRVEDRRRYTAVDRATWIAGVGIV
jgi:hypothetical protein